MLKAIGQAGEQAKRKHSVSKLAENLLVFLICENIKNQSIIFFIAGENNEK
jgi:hypothetical protein